MWSCLKFTLKIKFPFWGWLNLNELGHLVLRAARAEPTQLPGKCERHRQRCHIPEALRAFTWCFSYAAKTLPRCLCLYLRFCPIWYLLMDLPNQQLHQRFKYNMEINLWSQLWMLPGMGKQKCKCKHSAKPFPLGSTTYRHSLSLGKNCSTSQLQVISHTGDPWASPSSSSSLFLICKSQVHLFQADMLFATSWYRFLPSSILSLCIPVLNTYKVTSRLSSHLPELPVSRFNRGR